VLLKAPEFAHAAAGCALLLHKLEQLGLAKAQLVLGLGATSCYWANLYLALDAAGYQVHLLHPAQTAAFARQRGLRAKTDRLDAGTIARVLLSGEARPAYGADAQITAYRELVRLPQKLTDEAASYKLQLQSLLEVVFPEFRPMFADPTRPTALAMLMANPGAQAFVDAGVEAVAAKLASVAYRRYGQVGAAQLVELARQSVACGRASTARAQVLQILCDQLAHTPANSAAVEQEIAALVAQDDAAASLSSVPECGAKTVAVLRSEVGDGQRFARGDQLGRTRGWLSGYGRAASCRDSARDPSAAADYYGGRSIWRRGKACG
jgi:transposase